MSLRIQIDPDFGFSSYYSPQTHTHLHLGNQSIKQLINQSIGSLPDTPQPIPHTQASINSSINQPTWPCSILEIQSFTQLINQKTPFTTQSTPGKKIKQKREKKGGRGKKRKKGEENKKRRVVREEKLCSKKKKHNNITVLEESGEENSKDISFPLFLNGNIITSPASGKKINLISPQKY